jgi:hypothetical protein
MLDPTIGTGLILTWGACWTIAYIGMVLRGFGEKTYGMPAFALFFSLSWALIFSFIIPQVREVAPVIQLAINIIWFILGLLVLCTYFLYGKKHFPQSIGEKWFIPWSILGLATAFLFVLLMSMEFYDYSGMYAALVSYLLASVLFIDMLARRGSAEGQSTGIAVAKWVGTMAATAYFFLGKGDIFILYLGVACAVFDVIYIALLYRTVKASGKQAVPISVRKRL